MKRKALIVQGGWEGHEPVEVSEIFRQVLTESGSRQRFQIPWMLS